MAVFPHGSVPRVSVVPIGDPPERACTAVAETLREMFELAAPIRQAIETPSVDDPDGVNAVPFFEALLDATDGVDLAVGVTDARLRNEPHDFALFGVGLEFGSVGIVSTARLLEADASPDLDRERLETETRSVVGATLGLRTYLHEDRDDDRPCACAPGDALYQLDDAPTTYCADCRAALTGESPVLEAPGPDSWVVRPRDEATLAFAERWARGEPKWRDYPLVAAGLAVARAERLGSRLRPVFDRSRTALKRIPRPGPGTARGIPRPIHTIYRICSFWATIFYYVVWIFVWLRAFVVVHYRLAGPEFSTAALLSLLVVGLVGGIATGLFAKAFARGIYDGARGVPVDDRS